MAGFLLKSVLRIRIRIRRIRIFLGSWIRIQIHKSEVWIRILLSPSKKKEKPWLLLLLFDFLSLKNDLNVPSKSYQQKNFFNKILFFVGILKVSDENSGIWIRKRIRIH